MFSKAVEKGLDTRRAAEGATQAYLIVRRGATEAANEVDRPLSTALLMN